MKQDDGRHKNRGPKKLPKKENVQPTRSGEELRQAYAQQLEYFKSINHNGAYNAMLEFLMEELGNLRDTSAPDKPDP